MATEIIKSLRNTSSKNEKIKILTQHSSNILLQKILKYTYDPLVIWNIKTVKKIPEPRGYKELETIIDELYEQLILQRIRGNEAQKIVFQALENCSSREEQELIILMLKKDLKCGINKKIINSVFIDLIYEPEYMGAVTYDSKRVEKLISEENQILLQTKMDGMYVNILIDKRNGIKLISRSGKLLHIKNKALEKFYTSVIKSTTIGTQNQLTFCGEMVIAGYDRYTSNGLLARINKYYEKKHEGTSNKNLEKIKKEIEEIADCDFEELINKIHFYLWDMYTTGDLIPNKTTEYITRFFTLAELLQILKNESFHVVNTLIIIDEKFDTSVTLNEIRNIKIKEIRSVSGSQKQLTCKLIINDFYNKNIQNGEEGIIIKAGSKPFKNGKPVYQIKMKGEDDCDLKIVGFEPGTPGTKYENTLGVLLCEDASGKLKVRVGGIDEYWRDEIWNNKNNYLEKIVTVQHNGITKAKDKDTYSLMHPRFIKIRDDKTEADNLKTIKGDSSAK